MKGRCPRPLDEGDTLQHSLPAAFRCVLYAASGAHSRDALISRQPLCINLFKSMTSRRLALLNHDFARRGLDDYFLTPLPACGPAATAIYKQKAINCPRATAKQLYPAKSLATTLKQ
ncbi:protein of unknown function [Pseudomonas sp. JV241A]|nr:protein of unknown function [Pseudomonas sp. JV241A]